MALVTNGAACLQREKLTASGLSGYFDVVVVSSEFGVAKPDAAIFGHALAQMDSTPRKRSWSATASPATSTGPLQLD